MVVLGTSKSVAPGVVSVIISDQCLPLGFGPGSLWLETHQPWLHMNNLGRRPKASSCPVPGTPSSAQMVFTVGRLKEDTGSEMNHHHKEREKAPREDTSICLH